MPPPHHPHHHNTRHPTPCRGGSGGGSSKAPEDPKTVIPHDLARGNERPQWQLTCYGHTRGERNDVGRDVSGAEQLLQTALL